MTQTDEPEPLFAKRPISLKLSDDGQFCYFNSTRTISLSAGGLQLELLS